MNIAQKIADLATPRRVNGNLPVLDRFALHSIPEPNSGCWLWLSSAHRNHRPYFIVNGKRVLASRFAYRAFKGPITDGLWVLHTCHTSYCVNPEHLYLGTPSQNNQDMMRAGRHVSQHDPGRQRAMAFRMLAARRAKLHCRRGHELSGDNLKVYGGSRACKACRALAQSRFRQRRRLGETA